MLVMVIGEEVWGSRCLLVVDVGEHWRREARDAQNTRHTCARDYLHSVSRREGLFNSWKLGITCYISVGIKAMQEPIGQ
jgi:hypothetical protein